MMSFTPLAALTRIRGFVEHFFGCATCVHHFVSIYDSCSFGRCELAEHDGRGVALWLWRVHNNVTARIAIEHDRSPPPLWPALEYCSTCWMDHRYSAWNDTAVYGHLRRFYFVGADLVTPPLQQLKGRNDTVLIGALSLLLLGGGGFVIILAIGVCLSSHRRRPPSAPLLGG